MQKTIKEKKSFPSQGMGCPCCHASYLGTKLLPNGLRESSARAGGRAQPTKTLHLCSAGPAVPGPHGGPRATIHQHVTSEEKTHAGASEADRVSTQKRAKLFVLHTPPAFPFSAPSASEARDESKLSRRMRLSKGSAAVLLVTVRSAPASPPQLCAVPFRPRARPRCLHAVLSKGARIPPPVPASTRSCRGDGVTATLAWDRGAAHGDLWREPKPAPK